MTFRVTLVGLLLLLLGCSHSLTAPVQTSDLDQRITHMITGEDYWPDIKITYHGDSDSRLCYVAVADEEVWYGVATKVEGEWFVTIPSLDQITSKCSDVPISA